MFKTFALNFGWIFAAALLGFAITAVFAGIVPSSPQHLTWSFTWRWQARSCTALCAGATCPSATSSVTTGSGAWSAAVLVGAFTVRNVLSQPASPHSQGLSLAFDIAWLGIVYGALDALFLSVLPVLATWQAFSALGWTQTLAGKILVGAIALIASLLVTVAYHLGYPEYRAAGGVMGPSIGNGVMSLGYILTNNPIAAVFSHIAMHIAGVLQGPATRDAAPAALLKKP